MDRHIYSWCFYSCALILLAVPTFAQEKPDKPEPTIRMDMIRDSDNQKIKMDLPVPHRTADKAWWEWVVVSQVSTIIDVENTQDVLQYGGRELNPLYGSHPSRLRAYAVSESINAVATYFSYRYKREDDALRGSGYKVSNPKWWFIQAAVTGSHVFGTVFSLAASGR